MAATTESVELALTAGLPYNRRFRVKDGTLLWAATVDFEVRAQVRSGKNVLTPLVDNLAPFLTPSIDGGDIVVDLSLTGAHTRARKAGYYDIILSDPGSADARALPISSGKVKISLLVTAADDA